jgi:hypothetical protein
MGTVKPFLLPDTAGRSVVFFYPVTGESLRNVAVHPGAEIFYRADGFGADTGAERGAAHRTLHQLPAEQVVKKIRDSCFE